MISSLDDGVELLQFSNGLELVQSLEYTKDEDLPPAIILDVKMPIWDGIKTLNVLKAEARYAGIQVYMWSAADTKYEMDLCLQLGAEKFIVKPSTDEQRVTARIALAELLTKIEHK
jgi:CheY-like chemotaxis protein